MEENIGTSIDDFRKGNIKIITLPVSGLVVEIRKVSLREYNLATDGGFDLLGVNDIKIDDPQRQEKIRQRLEDKFNSLPKEEKIEKQKLNVKHNDALIILAAVNPKFAELPDVAILGVNEIDDKDYAYMLGQISEFSWGRRQDLKPFREEQSSDDNR